MCARLSTATSDFTHSKDRLAALERRVKVTYPDGTYEQTIYNLLDAEWARDRAGGWTRTTCDAGREVESVTDAAGRLVRKVYGDGMDLQYKDEAGTDRLAQMKGGKEQHRPPSAPEALRARLVAVHLCREAPGRWPRHQPQRRLEDRSPALLRGRQRPHVSCGGAQVSRPRTLPRRESAGQFSEFMEKLETTRF